MSNIQMVERIFAVLRVVAANTQGIGVTQISQQSGLPKSTVSRICHALEELQMLSRLPLRESNSRGFRLGPGLVALVANIPHHESLAAIAQPYLQHLHNAIGETVALTLPEGDHAYVLSQLTSQQAIQVRDWTGVRIPMYVQSTGRLFLAERTEEELARYLATPRIPYTSKTVFEGEALLRVLTQVRAQGYAWVFEEFEEGLSALATPVRNATGAVIAAVNVFGPSFRFPAEGQQELITRLALESAQKITAHYLKVGRVGDEERE